MNASYALAHLDADRLEEMALSCAMLVREAGDETRFHSRICRRSISDELAREMVIFARVLDGSRANLKVMLLVREMRTSKLEYGQPHGARDASAENKCGNR